MSYRISITTAEGEHGSRRLNWQLSTDYDLDDVIDVHFSFTGITQTFAGKAEAAAYLATILRRYSVDWLHPIPESGDPIDWTIDFSKVRESISGAESLPAWASGRVQVRVHPSVSKIANQPESSLLATQYSLAGYARIRESDLHLNRVLSQIDQLNASTNEHLDAFENVVEDLSNDVAPVALGAMRDLTKQLDFMTDDGLRQCVSHDLGEVDAAKQSGKINKGLLILCGSALEGVLFDVLNRRPDRGRAALKGNKRWPEHASLGVMLDLAESCGLLTPTTIPFAKAVKDHRDLIHPRQFVASGIVIDPTTASAMMHLLSLVVRDLSRAATSGKIAAYEEG